MKTLIVKLDEETANLLKEFPNMSEVTREALRAYIGHISTDTREGLRQAFQKTQEETQLINQRLKVLADLLEPIAKKAGVSYNPNEFSDWGA